MRCFAISSARFVGDMHFLFAEFFSGRVAADRLPANHVGPAIVTLVLGFAFIGAAGGAVRWFRAAIHFAIFEIHPWVFVGGCMMRSLGYLALAAAECASWDWLSHHMTGF